MSLICLIFYRANVASILNEYSKFCVKNIATLLLINLNAVHLLFLIHSILFYDLIYSAIDIILYFYQLELILY